VAVGRGGRTPAQRLMAVGDVDDRQSVEPEDDVRVSGVVGPRSGLVRPAVTDQVRRAGDRVDEGRGAVRGRVGKQGKHSPHLASIPNRAGVSRPAPEGGLRCVVFAWHFRLLGGFNVTPRGLRVLALSVVLGCTAVLLSGCSWSEVLGLGWPNGITPEAHLNRELWIGSVIASLVVGAIVWGLIFLSSAVHRPKKGRSHTPTHF